MNDIYIQGVLISPILRFFFANFNYEIGPKNVHKKSTLFSENKTVRYSTATISYRIYDQIPRYDRMMFISADVYFIFNGR